MLLGVGGLLVTSFSRHPINAPDGERTENKTTVELQPYRFVEINDQEWRGKDGACIVVSTVAFLSRTQPK